MENKELLLLLNPWWKDGAVSSDLAKSYKRKIFVRLFDLIRYRQIIVLSGLRRVGKTTLIYQNIESLLKEYDSKRIVYFNFDKRVGELTEILDSYSDLTQIDWKKEKIIAFFDEITKLKDWARKIKIIYDAFPNVKFIVSSSSSIWLESEALQNLAGRYFLINIKPLHFSEYLELKEKDKFLKNINLYEKDIKKEFKNYLLKNFPEVINWDDELLIKDYFKTTIIDKIVKDDLPDRFKNINKDLLFLLIELIYREPGMYLDYDSISRNLHISKKTLLQHLSYLEFSYLIKRIKNFRVSSMSVSRKMQRAYPYWWSLAFCYTNDFNKVIESVVASVIEAKYYWRKNGKEIDFLIIDENKIAPIEVKNKIELNKEDLKHIRYFLTEYNVKEGWIVYMGDKEGEEKIGGKKIKYIPLWKWLLEN